MYEFDEQTFVEHYLRDYSSNQDIAIIDDISCVLDNDINDDEKFIRLTEEGYFQATKEELQKELRELECKVLEQAFKDYIYQTYGKHFE